MTQAIASPRQMRPAARSPHLPCSPARRCAAITPAPSGKTATMAVSLVSSARPSRLPSANIAPVTGPRSRKRAPTRTDAQTTTTAIASLLTVPMMML